MVYELHHDQPRLGTQSQTQTKPPKSKIWSFTKIHHDSAWANDRRVYLSQLPESPAEPWLGR